MMLVYVFDGSFDGLLTAVFESYYRHEEPGAILSNYCLQTSLTDDFVNIHSDITKAQRVAASIKINISPQALENVYYAFLSELDGIYTSIYKYLKFGWQVGKNISSYLTDKRVMAIDNAVRKVTSEVHRMAGLLRFKELDKDLFYASIEPTHNITELLAPHFASRFSDQNWAIHDIKRNQAAVFNKDKWIMVKDAKGFTVTEAERELFIQNLWKKYFKSISIKSRENPKLQRQFMPGRYWKHLIEKQL